jgi:hypothetical protein
MILVLLVLLAAAVNVPWALTRMQQAPMTMKSMSEVALAADPAARRWPQATPASESWPPPLQWMEAREFGRSVSIVLGDTSRRGPPRFRMIVSLFGWPLPVIGDTQLFGETGKVQRRQSLQVAGLALNPLILGGGAWVMLVVLPWIVPMSVRRWWRRRHDRCLDCGYPVGVSPVCTECGVAVKARQAAA